MSARRSPWCARRVTRVCERRSLALIRPYNASVARQPADHGVEVSAGFRGFTAHEHRPSQEAA